MCRFNSKNWTQFYARIYSNDMETYGLLVAKIALIFQWAHLLLQNVPSHKSDQMKETASVTNRFVNWVYKMRFHAFSTYECDTESSFYTLLFVWADLRPPRYWNHRMPTLNEIELFPLFTFYRICVLKQHSSTDRDWTQYFHEESVVSLHKVWPFFLSDFAANVLAENVKVKTHSESTRQLYARSYCVAEVRFW